MSELIKVNYDGDQPKVSGRELHEFLGVETPYHIWFPRMCGYGFSPETDYCTKMSVCNGNSFIKEKSDHDLTIPMAKELCMIQRTARGKEARQYFLQLEAAWNTPEMVMSRALRMADAQIKSLAVANAQLEANITIMQPKVIFADAVSVSETTILIGDLAKILKQNGIETGQNRLFEWLRANGYLVKRKGIDYNMPTQRSMELGLFEIKETCITRSDGYTSINKTPRVTGKGQIYFVNKFKAA